jgi:hypothetical protein
MNQPTGKRPVVAVTHKEKVGYQYTLIYQNVLWTHSSLSLPVTQNINSTHLRCDRTWNLKPRNNFWLSESIVGDNFIVADNRCPITI